MAEPIIHSLPDELIEAIIFLLPPSDTLSFGSTCRRAHKIASEHLVWRRHCLQTWRYWDTRHDIESKRQQPPAQVRWRQLFQERERIDQEARESLNELLETQQHRIQRLERISDLGHDVKEVMRDVQTRTPDSAEDVLAQRYYAGVLLGQINRRAAIDKWRRLQQQKMVRLEEVLGAYDLFVLNGRHGDLQDLDVEFNRLATAIRNKKEGFDGLSTRAKALLIAEYLREQRLVGNPSEDDYHALRNNFLSLALFEEPHTSLPLQSVAIYCAVARCLGVKASPSNYPHHVHAVIEPPAGLTLDDPPVDREYTTSGEPEPDFMFVDPWRSSSEIPREQLTTRLEQMGAPPRQHASYLGPASTLEIAMRTGRNIMNSVQEGRGNGRQAPPGLRHPDFDAAWYAMLWAMMMMGDANPANHAATVHRRRQCLPYLIEHWQNHFEEDLGLFERYIVPIFSVGGSMEAVTELVNACRISDRNPKPPSPRDTDAAKKVKFPVGQLFKHKRFDYEGMIVGWDSRCMQDERWIAQMRVDGLPGGRDQPFYNIISDDKCVRYVAEENIGPLTTTPCESLLMLAGRYFKRWDDELKLFVSNIRDEYPDD